MLRSVKMAAASAVGDGTPTLPATTLSSTLYPLSSSSTPTYGPFGESEDVANPDKLGPTMFTDVSLTIDGEPAAVGDCVAAYRGDTGALCGLGKVLETPGSLTIVCYAPEGAQLNFKAWTAASGMDDPAIVACGKAIAPTVGEIVEETLTLAASTMMPSCTVGTQCSIDTGWVGYTVKNLPKGLKYDKNTGIVSGVPTAATDGKMVAIFTKKGEETQTLEFEVAALPSGATGTFNGFVQKAGAGEGETLNAGSLQVTVSDVGKITARVVSAAGTYSFTATGWDSVNEGVCSVEMTTKKGDVLTLACDSTAAWNAKQMTGTFTPVDAESLRVGNKDGSSSERRGEDTASTSTAAALSVVAQKNAFGKQWFFNATGDDANGWTLSFAENAKSAALTVTLNADGKTSVAGKLGAYKITASGYADVSGIGTGAIFADFAPVVTVGKTKKALSLRANLWFDKKDDHEEGVGSAVFVP